MLVSGFRSSFVVPRKLPNFLLSGPPPLFAANAGRCREVLPQNAPKSRRDGLLAGLVLMGSRTPRLLSPPGCGQCRKRALLRKRCNDRGVNLIGSRTDPPRVADRRSTLAAHAGIRRIHARREVSVIRREPGRWRQTVAANAGRGPARALDAGCPIGFNRRVRPLPQ